MILEPRETQVEVPVVLKEERAVEVPQVSLSWRIFSCCFNSWVLVLFFNVLCCSSLVFIEFCFGPVLAKHYGIIQLKVRSVLHVLRFRNP